MDHNKLLQARKWVRDELERCITYWLEHGMDKTYGALMARAKTAKMLLDSYLAGEIDRIDSLEEKRLERAVNGFLAYKVISSHTP